MSVSEQLKSTDSLLKMSFKQNQVLFLSNNQSITWLFQPISTLVIVTIIIANSGSDLVRINWGDGLSRKEWEHFEMPQSSVGQVESKTSTTLRFPEQNGTDNDKAKGESNLIINIRGSFDDFVANSPPLLFLLSSCYFL